MDEIIRLLTEIKYCLVSINGKLSDIAGNGLYSIEDLADKLDDIGNNIDFLSDKID